MAALPGPDGIVATCDTPAAALLQPSPFPVGQAVIGACVAFVTGVVALMFLRRVVIRGRFALFALWTVPLSLATLAMAAVWPP